MSKTDRDDAEKTVLSPALPLALPARPAAIGRFDIIRLLGQGGMGEVFLVTDREHPERGQFALKTIFPELMQDREVVSRFESEAKLLASIQHLNVVRLIECGTLNHDGTTTHFMAMEFIDGISLHNLARRRRLSLADALDIAIQVARGLHAIHLSRVVHRDLKPANVMITREGVAKIIDFGIAKPASMGMASDDDPERGFKTKTGMVIGTVNYIAPEILRGEPASIATDVYSLGLIIWEMVNGQTPFKSKSLAETMARVTGEMLEWSDAIFDIAPQGFTKVVGRLAAKDPQKRVPNALKAVEELEKIQSSANWAGRFGRKARFDVDLQWHPDTIESIRASGVKDSEVGFILQEVEALMIERCDERLSHADTIEVEYELLKRSIDSYKSMRYQAAMTKATRVREQIGVAAHAPVASGSSRNVHAARTSAVARYRKVASLVLSITIVAGTAMMLFSHARGRIREVASENQKSFDGFNKVDSAPIEKVAPVATRGSTLVYYIVSQTASGTELNLQQTRTLSEVSPTSIEWLVGERVSVSTPRGLIPLETFFTPIHRAADASVDFEKMGRLRAFEVGEQFTIKIENAPSNSVEETNCTIVSSRRQQLVNRIHEAWKIECLRKVSRAGQLTHRILEVYEYVPAVSSLLSLSVKTDEINPSGMISSSTTRRMELQLEHSKLQQSDSRELSPW